MELPKAKVTRLWSENRYGHFLILKNYDGKTQPQVAWCCQGYKVCLMKHTKDKSSQYHLDVMRAYLFNVRELGQIQ